MQIVVPKMVSPALKRGDVVFALRDLDGLKVPKNATGVVFEEANAYGDGFGPMVRFSNYHMCNVYAGDVVERSQYEKVRKAAEEKARASQAKEIVKYYAKMLKQAMRQAVKLSKQKR